MGSIGLNVIQGARLAGAVQIIGVDTNPQKETVARKMGATDFVNPAVLGKDLIGHLTELTRGGADFTFEAVGNVKLMRTALDCTRLGWGVCTMIGIAPDGDVMEVPPKLLIQGRTLKGSAMGGVHGQRQIPYFVDLMMDGKIDIASLITSRLRIEDINKGYAQMKRNEGIRSVVLFD